jgi:anti-anti-sigma regulatory factor
MVETTTFVKIHANHGKNFRLNSPKTTYVDDLVIHNLVKYLVQTQLHLRNIKITNFKSNLDKIFYKVVYHHIIYMCDFFGEFI